MLNVNINKLTHDTTKHTNGWYSHGPSLKKTQWFELESFCSLDPVVWFVWVGWLHQLDLKFVSNQWLLWHNIVWKKGLQHFNHHLSLTFPGFFLPDWSFPRYFGVITLPQSRIHHVSWDIPGKVVLLQPTMLVNLFQIGLLNRQQGKQPMILQQHERSGWKAVGRWFPQGLSAPHPVLGGKTSKMTFSHVGELLWLEISPLYCTCNPNELLFDYWTLTGSMYSWLSHSNLAQAKPIWIALYSGNPPGMPNAF